MNTPLSILAEIAEDNLHAEVDEIVQSMAVGYPGGYINPDDVQIVAADIEALAGYSAEQIADAAADTIMGYGIAVA